MKDNKFGEARWGGQHVMHVERHGAIPRVIKTMPQVSCGLGRWEG